MIKDEIIQELWPAKDATAAKYGHDAKAMAAALREKEKLSSATVIDLRARREAVPQAAGK